MPFRALFQARTGTWVEPSTFRKLAGLLPHMNESEVIVGIRTHSGEGQVVWSQRPLPLGHGRPVIVIDAFNNALLKCTHLILFGVGVEWNLINMFKQRSTECYYKIGIIIVNNLP
jgi:hypothetical protein